MRTDSVRVSEDALTAVREHISTAFGADYPAGEAERLQDQGRCAGRARSDSADLACSTIPKPCGRSSRRISISLYRLIWNRFVASQMLPATFDETTVDVTAADYIFRVKGTVPKFAGWMATYGLTPGESTESADKADDDEARQACCRRSRKAIGSSSRALRPEQKFTQPPPRFTEATLVKELEENGIGRPSTYASIIGVLQDRDYVNKLEGRFKPTPSA